MTIKIDGTNGIDVAQLRAPDGDPVAMTIDNVGAVAFPQMGQAWTTFTVPAQRNLGVAYVNDTDQTIDVNVSAASTTVGTMSAIVAGHTLRGSQLPAAAGRASIYFRVPPGASYQVDLIATTSAIFWEELR
jgi:hypothetical protein